MTPRGSFLRWLREFARSITRGARRAAELRAEVSSYVDLLTEEKVAAGLTTDAARRAALLEFHFVLPRSQANINVVPRALHSAERVVAVI